jgi:hypothetical protein
MIDDSKLVRRAPARPLVWLGERERAVEHRLGERFPAYPAKEKDFLDAPAPRRQR